MSTTEIERRPLTPLDVGQTRAAIQQYQVGLKALLDPAEDVQSFTDRKGVTHAFVKRSGWRKIALWCDLNIENRGVEIDRDKNGRAIRARVIARAVSPSGRFADGEGAADITERMLSEHDLVATAATRAVNRATSNLVGLGAVSAEEVDGASEPMTPGAPYGPPADAELTAEAAAAVEAMWPDISGVEMVKVITSALGEFPEVAARTIKGLAWFMSADDIARAAATGEPEKTGPEFEEIVTPEPEVVATPSVEKAEAETTPSVENDDEVDIDTMFDAESKFME